MSHVVSNTIATYQKHVGVGKYILQTRAIKQTHESLIEPCDGAFSPRFRRDFDAPPNRHATSVSGWR